MYNHKPAGYKCPFCILASGQDAEYNLQNDIIFRNEQVIAFVGPKWWVNNPGSVIIIPVMHFENIYDIPDSLLGLIHVTGKKIGIAIKQAYNCEGLSFRQHNEPAGDQNVWHYHLNVFPRWKGDDLYLNDNNAKYVTPTERLPYIEKLKKILDST